MKKMEQYGKKNRKRKISQTFLRGLAVAATIPGFLCTTVLFREIQPAFQHWGEDTAVFSALYSLPDQTLEGLQRRFAGETQPPETAKPQKEPPTSPNKLPDSQESHNPPGYSDASLSQNLQPAPEIPEEYRGAIIEENFSVPVSADTLSFGNGVIKNTTSRSDSQAKEYLEQENPVRLDRSGPQVLIMHTHATESFEPYDSDSYDTRHTWRSTDNRENMVAVGEEMAQAIRKHGIEVLHDDTQHDYPSYNGSYERSAQTVNEYLKQYPSIKVVLDVHRDAVQRESTLVKPIVKINGKKAAQLMIIAGCDDGTMDMPDWGKNFRFAAGMQDAIESGCPGLTRPVFFCYRKYNQDLTSGSLLLEIGSHGNTLEEVLYTARLAGDQIGRYLKSLEKNG